MYSDEVALSLLDSIGSDAALVVGEHSDRSLGDLAHDPALETIPVFRALWRQNGVAGRVRTDRFAGMLLRFLHGATAAPEARATFMLRYAGRTSRCRVARVLLLLLDQADDRIKAEVIGRLFARFLAESIEEGEMLEAGRRLLDVELDDLRRLANTPRVADLEGKLLARLAHEGLVDGPEARAWGHGDVTWHTSAVTDLGGLLLDCLRLAEPRGVR